MRNIVLTGFMASGKTEISKAIALMCDCKVVDIDAVIVEKEGRDINTIFAENGEEYFRDLESEAAKEVSMLENAVIATGGGTVLRSGNIEVLRKTGTVYYLAPSFEVIAGRIEEAAKTRPLMKGQSIDEIRKRFESRIPFYENCDVKIEISAEDSPSDIAKIILDKHNTNERN